jgi:hypothetical protein
MTHMSDSFPLNILFHQEGDRMDTSAAFDAASAATGSVPGLDRHLNPSFQLSAGMKRFMGTFLIMAEDIDGEIILFSDSFVLRQRYAKDEHNITITIPMF